MQPAFFLMKPRELISDAETFSLNRYTLKYYALVLLRASAMPEDAGSTAENVMDNILDALDAAMQGPRPGEPQTLGGLVIKCSIDGEITIDTPVLFEQCAIWIPITVVVGI